MTVENMVLKTANALERGSRASASNVQMIFFNKPDGIVTHDSSVRPRHDTANRLGEADLDERSLDNEVCRTLDARSVHHTFT